MSNELPSSAKAEQHLLGILLHDHTAIERVPAIFKPTHMHDPVHERICAAVLEAVHRGGVADPVVLMERFQDDQAFQDVGGFGYLADLVDHAPSASHATDLCHLITDMALRRDMIRECEELIKTATKDRERTALDQIDAFERRLYQMTATREESGPQSFDDVLGAAIARAAEAYQRDGELVGLSTGLMDLDRKLGGLARTNMITIAARPSMGKTSLGVDMAVSNAKAYKQERQEDGSMKTVKGGVAAIFSLEMSVEELGIRILSNEIGISSDRINRGQLSVEDFSRMRDAAIEIRDAPLYIDDTPSISLAALATRCRRLKRTVGLDLVVVDLIQLVTIGGEEKLSPNERVTRVMNGLKALAKELDIAMVGLSHLTRKVEDRPDKKPMLQDLKESGSIEQDSDVVMFLYRHAYYLEREQPKEGSAEHMKWEIELEKCRNEAEVIIGKQRHGPVGTVKLLFNGDTTKFSDTIKDEEFQPRNAA